MNTHSTKASEIKRQWRLVDADGAILGRLASQVAKVLIGKDKPNYTPHLDCGDYVVVINAAKVVVTGRKAENKGYLHHSGYPGGFKKASFQEMFSADPRSVIIHAVAGMLPQNKLKDNRLARLTISVDAKNPFEDKFIKKNA